MLSKLREIIDKRNNGEITKEEAERLKYELVKDDSEKDIEIDNSCTT